MRESCLASPGTSVAPIICRFRAGMITALVCALAHSVCGAGPSERRRFLTVILCSGVTVDAIRDPALPALDRLSRSASIGLVSAPLPRHATAAHAALIAASGLEEQEAPGVAPLVQLETPDGRATFQRRLGRVAPHGTGFIANWAQLEELGWADRLVAVRANRHRFAVASPNDREVSPSAAALAADANGSVSASPNPSSDVVVQDVGPNTSALDAAVGQAMALSDRVVVCTLWPGRRPVARSDRLGFAALWGKGISRGLLSSPTTRTHGLVALTDLGPTVITMLGGTRGPGATGTPWQTTPGPDPAASLLALDRLVSTNLWATVPLLAGIGVVLGLAALAGLTLGKERPRVARRSALLVLWCMQMPAGMLLAEACISQGAMRGLPLPLASAAVVTLLAMTALAAAISFGSRGSGADRADGALRLTFRLMVGAIALDGLFGFRLAGLTPLSGFQLAGTRYYGIGNEFSGLLIGAAILWSHIETAPRAAVLSALGAIGLLVAHPALGADAGGTIAATVGFGAAALQAFRRRVTPTWGASLVATGLAVATGIAWLDRSARHPSHIGAAVGSAQAHGLGALMAIIQRKVMMNVGLAIHPITLAALAGVAVTLAIARRRHKPQVDAVIHRHPSWTQHLVPLAWATVVGIVLNDSGIVFGLFSGGIALVSGLWLLFTGYAEAPDT